MTESSLLLARARALLDISRGNEAVDALRQLLAVEPDDARAWRMLAYAHAQLGDHRAALDAANRSLALDPNDEWGHRLTSSALGSLRRWVPAMEAAQESVRLEPENWLGQAHLAHALLDRAVNAGLTFTGKFVRAARQAADRTVELAPDQPGAHYCRARLHQRLRQVEQARAGYRRVLELDPHHVGALTALGELEPSVSDSANLFGSALRTDPLSGHARRNLRNVGFRVLLGYGLLAFLWTGVELAAGLTTDPPWWGPPTAWIRAAVVVAGLLALALPALVLRRRLDPPLRSFLLRMPLDSPWIGGWAAALAGAWLALIVLPLLPTPGRVLAVQTAVAFGVPGFFVPTFVVAVPLAAERIGPAA